MTSWPNIPKGLRRGMSNPRRRSYDPGRIDWARAAGGRGPYPCKHPGCGLVYTPGYYKEHARGYHGDRLGRLKP